jgi:hypothetical protein
VFRAVRNYFNLSYGTPLMFDNLMDFSLAHFLHKGLISEGMGEKTRATMTTADEGDCVRVRGIRRVDLSAVDAGKQQNAGVRLIVNHCVTPEPRHRRLYVLLTITN